MVAKTESRHSDEESEAKRFRIRVSLRLKIFFIVILTLLPLAAVVIVGTYAPGGSFGITINPLFEQAVSFGSISIDLYLIMVLCAIALGAGVGYALAEGVFVEPVKALSTWLSITNEAETTSAAIFPQLPHDELGMLGRSVSSMAARNLLVEEHDRHVTDEKSTFLMIAAHQLRTPIAELTWSIEELLDPAVAQDTKQTIIQNLGKPLRRTRFVINHILAAASMEEKRFGYVFEQIDIVPVIARLVDDFKELAEEHGTSLSFEHDSIPLVYADAERISLALFDLITNAIDYTPKGGRVTVRLKPASNDRIEVIVADTGIGIPEKDLPFIFTRFHRGENALHLRPNGSGLGLYLVKNVINRHGSEVFVDSNETIGGTRFSFFLSTKAPK